MPAAPTASSTSRRDAGHHAGDDRRSVQSHRRRRHAEPRKLLVCTPASRRTRLTCARTILSTLATRAFRRPIAPSSAELDTPLQFYRGRAGKRSFEFGIERAVARILVDPQFLFRFEREPAAWRRARVSA
jgi:hypothetical protein